MEALEQQKVVEEAETSPSKEAIPTSSRKARLSDAADSPSISYLNRAMTGTTLNDRLIANSPELTPSISEEDPDFTGSLPMLRQRSGTSNGKARRSFSQNTSEAKAYPPSPRTSEEGSAEVKRTQSSSGTTTMEEVSPKKREGQDKVVDAVTEAMEGAFES